MNNLKKIIIYVAMTIYVTKISLSTEEINIENPLVRQNLKGTSYQKDIEEQNNLFHKVKSGEIKKNLLELPSELIFSVIRYVSGNDLISTRFVCMTLKLISTDVSILVPSEDKDILKLLVNSRGALPANFKLLLTMRLKEEQKNSLSKRFLEFARNNFCLHDAYEKEAWRLQSNKYWRFFLMFNYLAEKLDSPHALEIREEVLDEKFINLDSFEGDLIKCDPCPNLSKAIHIFWWEQIARIDADQRAEIIQAYKDGGQIFKNEIRAQYWENFDFEKWLFHSEI